MGSKGTTYKDSGVDIEKASAFISKIKKRIDATRRSEVMSGIGGFSGLFRLRTDRYKEPVLVSSTDGVGTKLKIAFLTGRHDTVGIDLVAMCVNDILVQGAEPLFFLDYFATGKLETDVAERVIEGIIKGCQEAGCALLGGETAELPSFYSEGEYDLAGFVVGVVDRDRIVDSSSIQPGDSLIGIASSGLHSNGYSLARRILFEVRGLHVNDRFEWSPKTVGEELLIPTKIYAKMVLPLLEDFTIKGMAHITGGGIVENLPRILPEGCRAVIHREKWRIPLIFKEIQSGGEVPDEEMWKTFNMGIGMILVVPEEKTEEILQKIQNTHERAYRIGEVLKRSKADPPVVIS